MAATTEIIVQDDQDRTLSSELLTKIFLFLNIKQVAQLQRVCKIWRELINDRYFIRLFYNQTFFLVHCNAVLFTNRANLVGQNDHPTEFDFLPLLAHRTYADQCFVGLANEVFCICTRPYSIRSFALCYGFALTTPEKVVKDCAPPSGLKSSSPGYLQQTAGIGFGYDIHEHDYRIFSIKKYTNGKSHRTEWIAKIYSLKHDTWKYVVDHPLSDRFPLHFKVEFSHGSFYWLVEKESAKIFLMRYDLYEEKFTTDILLPGEAPKIAWLTTLNGEIFIYYRSSVLGDYEVWVLNWESSAGTSSIRSSWTKLVNIPHSESNFAYMPVGYLKEQNIVLLLGQDLQDDPLSGSCQSFLLWYHIGGKIVKFTKISEGLLQKSRDLKQQLGKGQWSLDHEVPKSKMRLLCQ